MLPPDVYSGGMMACIAVITWRHVTAEGFPRPFCFAMATLLPCVSLTRAKVLEVPLTNKFRLVKQAGHSSEKKKENTSHLTQTGSDMSRAGSDMSRANTGCSGE